MSLQDPQPFLTAEEVARILRVSPKTIYRYADQGTLPSVRIGGTVRIPQKQLAAYLAQKGLTQDVTAEGLQARAKCGSCLRLVPQDLLSAQCLAPGCDARLCVDCQSRWPELLCPAHRPSVEQRLALALASARHPVPARETARWEHDLLERFRGAVERQSTFVHPLGGGASRLEDARSGEERWELDPDPLAPQEADLPKGVCVVYRFPASKAGAPRWALAAGVLVRLGRLAREGFDAEPLDDALWQAWLGQLSQDAALERRLWVVAAGAPTGWSNEVKARVTGTAQQRPLYNRWVAPALLEEKEGTPQVWTNPADGRLKPYLHLFLGRLPAEAEAGVRSYVQQQWREGSAGVPAEQAQRACQVDAAVVQQVFHLVEKEGMGVTQWVQGFGLVLFKA